MLIKPSFNLNRSIPDLHIYLKISMYFFYFFQARVVIKFSKTATWYKFKNVTVYIIFRCFSHCFVLFFVIIYLLKIYITFLRGFFGLGLFVFRLFVIFSSLSSLWTVAQCEAMVFTVYSLIILNLGKTKRV